MERKTKHRILGVFAIAALVVIVLPLFQSGDEPPTETKLVKAPPFPDQSVQVATEASASPDQPVIPVQSPQAAENDAATQSDIMSSARPTVVNEVSPAKDETPPAKVAEAEPAMSPEGDDFKTTVSKEAGKPSDISASVKTAYVSKLTKEPTEQPVIKAASAKKAKLAEKSDKKTQAIKVAKLEKKRLPPVTNAPLTDNGLVDLKNPVWVIQIGSFKNKANALRLVNQLRANGYRAFIQQISNTFGENTRVFVGPEYKRHSARALASRLESDMHIRGIVISYKPLAL